ncbi:hypothetical protein HK405_003446 [Cladochytrium tenue]|nr:hypothetical protein HK405_003446 [Cladochytrium tenue]
MAGVDEASDEEVADKEVKCGNEDVRGGDDTSVTVDNDEVEDDRVTASKAFIPEVTALMATTSAAAAAEAIVAGAIAEAAGEHTGTAIAGSGDVITASFAVVAMVPVPFFTTGKPDVMLEVMALSSVHMTLGLVLSVIGSTSISALEVRAKAARLRWSPYLCKPRFWDDLSGKCDTFDVDRLPPNGRKSNIIIEVKQLD